MVGIEKEGSVLNTSFNTFATLLLPLFSGPQAKIRIGSASHEYKLPKNLLCEQAPYFATMFQEDRFKEGDELSTTLEEIDGVVSTRSFEMLVQWVCTNRIIFDNSPLAEAITASIEFARLADMCSITGLESSMAEHIKQIILSNKSVEKDSFGDSMDKHLDHLSVKNIKSCLLLPKGHSVRKMLASAAVKDYLSRDHRHFFMALQGSPDFAVDLLEEVGIALDSLEVEKRGRGMTYKDPFSGQRVNL